MAKPDAQAFAKNVLWNLSALRAELYETQLLVAEILAAQKGISPAEVQARWNHQTEDMTWKLFREALASAQLEDEPPPSKSPPPKPRK